MPIRWDAEAVLDHAAPALTLAGLSFPLFSAPLAAALASLRGTTLPLVTGLTIVSETRLRS